MVQSIANFTNFLQSEAVKEQQRPASASSQDPAWRIMMTLRDHGTVPLANLTKLALLSAEAARTAVETLRSMERAEVIQFGEGNDEQLCLRLTPLGYAAMTGLP